MRIPPTPLMIAAVVLLVLAPDALAIPTPTIATPVPPSATPSALTAVGLGAGPAAATGFQLGAAVGTALGWGAWVLANWAPLGQLIAALVAFYTALRTKKWSDLVALAGEIAFNLATLTEFDHAKKRDAAVVKLYEAAGPLARSLFTEQQFALAVETGYKLIAKPQLAEPAAGT